MRCRALKPPRAHHCSTCSRCILRMDHHCPWVGNCVGLYNHKFFLMFVLHATIGCLIVAITMICHLYHLGMRYISKSSVHNAAVPMVSAALVLALGGLFGFHSYLICNNLSTLEIDQLEDVNVYKRIRKVVKTAEDKRKRDPLKIVFGIRNRGIINTGQPVAGRQMKQLVDYKQNISDTMGYDWRFWAAPCAPSGD